MNKNDFLQEYIQVNQRILKFYEKYPEGSIQTQILFIDNEKVVIKALAYRNKEDVLPSVGHAEEIRNSSYINRTNAVENCETSAVGRALANMGFEIKHAIASKEEMQSAISKQEYYNQEQNSAEHQRKEIFSKAKAKGIDNSDFKNICQQITSKDSSRKWSQDDMSKLIDFIESYNADSTHN